MAARPSIETRTLALTLGLHIEIEAEDLVKQLGALRAHLDEVDEEGRDCANLWDRVARMKAAEIETIKRHARTKHQLDAILAELPPDVREGLPYLWVRTARATVARHTRWIEQLRQHGPVNTESDDAVGDAMARVKARRNASADTEAALALQVLVEAAELACGAEASPETMMKALLPIIEAGLRADALPPAPPAPVMTEEDLVSRHAALVHARELRTQADRLLTAALTGAA